VLDPFGPCRVSLALQYPGEFIAGVNELLERKLEEPINLLLDLRHSLRL
jgi:hypothetical protein